MKILRLIILSILLINLNACYQSGSGPSGTEKKQFLDDLQLRTFNYFWDRADKSTHMIDDRYPTPRFTSIAATGFGLSSYLVGIENGFISREQGTERVLSTLRWLWESKQGEEPEGISGHKGFYYHFLQYGKGTRYQNVELSTIDTGLLMAGILSCQSYFDQDSPDETEIRDLADSLYLRVEWDWAMNGQEHMSMGWRPENGFIPAKWTGYNEAMILIIMAMGSPSHPVHEDAWESWCDSYEWADFYGYEHVNFHPLFGHQYSHMFIDFRGIQDPYMREKGIDYFENSRRATLSNRAYCIANPSGFNGYSENSWGLTACDGPGGKTLIQDQDTIEFWTYKARGASDQGITDDGTIAPTAAGGSIPFAPEECISALYRMKNEHGDLLYQEYGFKDAFNMTWVNDEGRTGWYDPDYIGIDQGPILIQAENYETGLIWELMKKNPYIVSGLQAAGFSGGWLDEL